MQAYPDSQLFLLLSGHLLGSTFPAWQLAKSLKEVSWRNCKFHLVSFSSLRDHFCLYYLMSCVLKMVISYILSLFSSRWESKSGPSYSNMAEVQT